MKPYFYSIAILLLTVCASFNTMQINSEEGKVTKDAFQFTIYEVGFGSNRFQRQPEFTITDSTFTLERKQMWMIKGDPKPKADTIQTGKFEKKTIEQLITLAQGFETSEFYDSNPYILSGSELVIEIDYNGKTQKIELKNIYNPIVEKMIALINPYITEEKYRFHIFPKDF